MGVGASVRIEPFYLACLAHASYLVASGDESAVVDPQRDVEIYLNTAAELGVRIRFVIETHLHADFVSGHLELAARTGAEVLLGAGSGAELPHRSVSDGDSITFGSCRMDFLSTPGHTMESICAVLTDLNAPATPRAVFTGDTLFVGDVGRPDLSPDKTPEQLAGLLYRSLQDKLLKLPDSTEVFPAHGAGSLCGRQLGAEHSSTIGKERSTNYAVRAANKAEFVRLLTDTLPARPEYFSHEVELNRQGAGPLVDLPALPALSADEFARLQGEGFLVVDTRSAQDFATAHLPGSINLGLGGQFASWAARVMGLDRRIIIVADDSDKLQESRLRLARVGIEQVSGYLDSGIAGWSKSGRSLEYVPRVTAADLAGLRCDPSVTVVDVREPGEFNAGHIDGAANIPLGTLEKRIEELDRNHLIVVHCKGGYRSSIATGILQRAGFSNVADLAGGYDGWASVAPITANTDGPAA